jgi:mannose-1-phosphate guanylyltransferase
VIKEEISVTSEVDVDAVVLVGGKGTRLRPLTLSAPKPMLPTAGTPYLSHLFSRIREAGIRHVVLGTSYRAEVFEEYFGDGKSIGLDLEYVVEEEPLDTAGAIRNVYDKLRAEQVIVFNGDILSGADLGEQLRVHRESGADVTLHLQRVPDPSRFGSVPTDETGRVQAFLEKTPNPPTDQINAGCYVFRRPVIEAIPTGRRVSVERETFPQLLEQGAHIQGFVDASYWLDVGTPEAFVRGSADLVRGVAPTSALPGRPGEFLVLDGASVAEDAQLSGGSTIGVAAVVGSRAKIDG